MSTGPGIGELLSSKGGATPSQSAYGATKCFLTTEKQRFAWPATGSGNTVTLTPKELEWLLEGFDLWANYPHKTLNYQSIT